MHSTVHMTAATRMLQPMANQNGASLSINFLRYRFIMLSPCSWRPNDRSFCPK